MGTRLKGAIAFTALPQGFEKEIVARDLKVFVGEELVASTQLPVAEGPFTFEVEQGSEGRVEYRYVDDAGNVSDDAKVLPFVATDTFAPPTPVDGTLTFEEVPDPVDPVEPV